MQTKLIWLTPQAEELIVYCARVSSPDQDNPEISGLINYCIRKRHWSIFEQAAMCVEIQTSRAISAQILRHRSFSFQEFSQRYAPVTNFEYYKARRQAEKNRQSSIDDMDDETVAWFYSAQNKVIGLSQTLYREALERGIAKEQARFLLPTSASTKLYMTGSIRSWIHYLDLRTKEDVQLEHREIALQIKDIFRKELPTISKALAWNN